MYSYDLKALSYVPAIKCWKYFRDEVGVFLWEDSRDSSFFKNSIDSSNKIQFTVSFPTDNT